MYSNISIGNCWKFIIFTIYYNLLYKLLIIYTQVILKNYKQKLKMIFLKKIFYIPCYNKKQKH